MSRYGHLIDWFDVSFSGDDEPSVYDDVLTEDILRMNRSIARNTDDVTTKGVFLLSSFDDELRTMIGIRHRPSQEDMQMPAAVFKRKYREDIELARFRMLKSLLCIYFLPRVLLEYDRRGYDREVFANFLDLFMKRTPIETEYIMSNLSVGTQENVADTFRGMAHEVVKILDGDAEEDVRIRLYDKVQMFFRVPFLMLYLTWENRDRPIFVRAAAAAEMSSEARH